MGLYAKQAYFHQFISRELWEETKVNDEYMTYIFKKKDMIIARKPVGQYSDSNDLYIHYYL